MQKDSPNHTIVLSIGNAHLAEVEGERVLDIAGWRFSLERATPGLVAALSALVEGYASEEELVQLVQVHDGAAGLGALFYQLRQLDNYGRLRRSVATTDGASERRILATLVAISPYFQFSAGQPRSSDRLRLSRFAFLRRGHTGLELESPTAHCRLLIRAPEVTQWLHALAEACPQPEVPEDAGALELLLGMLHATGLVESIGDEEVETNPALRPWAFHDLLFHSRSRIGRHDGRSGKFFPMAEHLEPLPALKPRPEGLRIPLQRADITNLRAGGCSLTDVLESRKSQRVQGEVAIDLATLGQFLDRCARVREFSPPSTFTPYEITRRPYPSGGASYELELYICAHACTGLERGLYHYDPSAHELTRISGATPEVSALLHDTMAATGGTAVSQLLICIAARFARVSWSYEGIAYATTLKNVGALLQTMYLVATDMQLAGCALGRGNSDLFSAATATDYYHEGSVGEFMLGSRATASEQP